VPPNFFNLIYFFCNWSITPKKKETMEAPKKIVYILPFQWLHEIFLLKRLPFHFWPGLIPLATITLPIHSA
jgi:hypothetical protein